MTINELDIASKLKAAKNIGVVTGAGISVASGISAYRGTGGIYNDEESGDAIMEALNGDTLGTDPQTTWKALLAMARQGFVAKPNAAHLALARMERLVPEFSLLTQNVDGLHHLAGSEQVIEIHGNLRRTRCTGCGTRGALTLEHAVADQIPVCPDCDQLMRPDVVLFGEMLDEFHLRALQERFLRRTPDVVMMIGTTSVFPYIVEPARVACELRRTVIEINPDETAASRYATIRFREGAEVVLPRLLDQAFGPPS